METFASRVKARREALGLTQEQLARKVGAYGGVVVSRWENGGPKPHDPDVIVKLADALGVTTDWLLRDEVARAVEAITSSKRAPALGTIDVPAIVASVDSKNDDEAA